MTANAMNPDKDPYEAVTPEIGKPAAPPLINWDAVRPLDVAARAVVAAALGWSYAPNISSLVRTWNREPDYSHGFLVLPIALVILWKTWPADPEAAPRPWLPGWLLVIAALAERWLFHDWGKNWNESATLLAVVV